MAEAAFEETVQILTKVNAGGSSLQDHLTTVLLTVAKERTEGALECFEDLSNQMKAKLESPFTAEDLSSNEACRDRLMKTTEANAKLAASDEVPDGEDPPEEEEGLADVFPDIMTNSNLFQTAGVVLGQEEQYKLYCSIDLLIKDYLQNKEQPFAEVKFFGKIFGLKNDYYILETKFQDPPEVEMDEGSRMEAPGNPGVNEHTYFVTTSLTDEWVALPHVQPHMMLTAKPMRRYFTGDLKAPVHGFPRFPWDEATYLRCQIARIACATHICPKGIFEPAEDEESGGVQKAETPVFLTTEEAMQYENWVHHKGWMLNKQARLTPFVNEDEPEEEEDEATKPPEEEKEDPRPALSPIDEDKSAYGDKVWSIRCSANPKNPNSVVSVHHLQWPGSVSVSKKTTWVNIYVGWGLKYQPFPYSPPPPPEMAAEYVAVDPAPPLSEQNDPPQKFEEEKKEEDQEEDEED